jgi:hypothetical protein
LGAVLLLSLLTIGARAEPGRLLNFTSILQAGVGLRYVNNSGICETTPGVHTMSGYVEVGTGMSMVRVACRCRTVSRILDALVYAVVLVFRSSVFARDRTVHVVVRIRRLGVMIGF